MLLLSLTNEEMVFLTDISKTVIPLFAALGGAMTGSYLTYRYQRKDKIRDHLFSYKVKSYTILVEGIIEVRRDLEVVRNAKFIGGFRTSKTAKGAWENYRKVTAEQSLFVSEQTREDLEKLNRIIYEAVEIEILFRNQLTSEQITNAKEFYNRAIYECLLFVKKVQEELGLHNIHQNNNRKK
ncbi:hypothetical protein [Chryseobacterium arthrosphaerae]|uniref:hypothetical protein n=1 Tax=Chryseobacterium arthrosphaerae TaxID=651561 RepID=UPI00241CE4AE|nr:hypothetical protein [Chryseobacterium arthrosphaerae]